MTGSSTYDFFDHVQTLYLQKGGENKRAVKMLIAVKDVPPILSLPTSKLWSFLLEAISTPMGYIRNPISELHKESLQGIPINSYFPINICLQI